MHRITRHHTDSMRRWKVGHHAFFVFIDGINTALHRFETHVEAAEIPAACAALETATSLMWGSAAALHFAGDFPEDDYEHIVRKSMSPPFVSDGFSGLMSADHAQMVKSLKKLRPIFRNLPVALKRQHNRFLQAMEAAYGSHIFVCENFKGGESPSLRMAQKSSKTSVDVLEGLKAGRMSLVDTDGAAAARCPFHSHPHNQEESKDGNRTDSNR